MSQGHTTRAEFLKVVGAASTWVVFLNALVGCKAEAKSLPANAPEQPEYVQAFRSRPDLTPATIEVITQAHGTAPGYIFIALKEGAGEHGPMIIDDTGNLVWFGKYARARDFKVQYFHDEPVLTWWEGRVVQGHGVGEYVIFDGFYQEITRVRAGNGLKGDLHEFLITPRDTALLTAYEAVRMDLSSVGGREDGVVWGGIAQELDIETGEMLFEWRSLDHVGIEDSYAKPSDESAPFYDYFHINSIALDNDGNLLISSRNTSAVYKIDRESGEILWRLGGKRSNFEMGPGTRTAFQHDARRHGDGTITIFDNGAGLGKVHKQSRGIVVDLDENEMRATLLHEYTSPEELLATSQGNVQALPNSNVFVGWGSEPYFSEFSSEGKLLLDARFPPNGETYRAFRFPWKGFPTDAPAVSVDKRSSGQAILYASWNGATEVATWQVLTGPSPDKLKILGTAPRKGFETAITLRTSEPYVGVRARDRFWRMLGVSKVINLGDHAEGYSSPITGGLM